MKNNELNDRRLQATPRGIGVMCNFYADKAENATVWDVEGNEYIDFAAGIAVLNTGHRHQKIISAIEKQLHAFTHTAYQIVPYEGYVSLAERINGRVPIDGPAKTAFFYGSRGGRKRGKNCPRIHQTPWPDYLWWRLPWAHLYDHGADRESRTLQAGLRAVSWLDISRPIPQ